jgi:hypothetical protein
MLSILLVFLQALAGAKMQYLRAPPQLMGQFRGNKHPAHGVSNHFTAMRRRGRGGCWRTPGSSNTNVRGSEKRPKTPRHRLEKERQDDKFKNVEQKTSHKRSDGLSLSGDALGPVMSSKHLLLLARHGALVSRHSLCATHVPSAIDSFLEARQRGEGGVQLV